MGQLGKGQKPLLAQQWPEINFCCPSASEKRQKYRKATNLEKYGQFFLQTSKSRVEIQGVIALIKDYLGYICMDIQTFFCTGRHKATGINPHGVSLWHTDASKHGKALCRHSYPLQKGESQHAERGIAIMIVDLQFPDPFLL